MNRPRRSRQGILLGAPDTGPEPPDDDDPSMILSRVRRRINDGWCQGAYARDIGGYLVGSYSSRAVSWCLHGALAREAGSREQFAAIEQLLLGAAAEIAGRPYADLAQFNDGYATEPEDVLKAIEVALVHLAQSP